MAISTAAAIIGSSLIGGAVAMNSASQQRRAASQGLAAQTEANDRALAEQRAAREQIMGVNQRFLGGGGDAFDLLLEEFGVRPRAPAGQPGAAPAGDYQAYLAANPDLKSTGWLDQHRGEWGDLTGDGKVDDLDTAAKHYELHGKGEGRALPQASPRSPGKPEGGNAGVSPLEPAPDLLTAARPDAGQAPTFQRPDAPQAPTFQRPDQPTYTAPQAMPEFRFDPASLRDDPGYRFLLEETTNNVNSGFGARGLLRSGGAMKALQDRSMGVADQYLGNIFNRALQGYQTNAGQRNADRAFGYNVFTDNRNNLNRNAETDYGLNTDAYRFGVNRGDRNAETDFGLNTDAYRFGVGRQDRNFDADRNFQRGERDTRVGNIFQLADYGMRAAGNVSGAATNYANRAGEIFGSQANAQADAAAQRAQANAYAGGAIGNAVGNIFAAWPGSQPNLVGGAAGSAFNPNYRGYGPSGY